MAESDEIKILLNSLRGVFYEVTNTTPYIQDVVDRGGTIFTTCLDIAKTYPAIYTRIGLYPSLDQFITGTVSKSRPCDEVSRVVLINVKGDEVEVLMGLHYTLQHHLVKHVIITIYPSLRPVHVYLDLLSKLLKWGYQMYHVTFLDSQGSIKPVQLENLYEVSQKTLLISDSFSTSC